MAITGSLRLAQRDDVNDAIWLHHLTHESVALNSLDPNKFSVSLIRDEIATGCSPVPDILTDGFGIKPSVMFVSTVYGFVYDYLRTSFERENVSWVGFVEQFYNQIIQENVGIYRRLNGIYALASDIHGGAMEFCFTELVKTVLISPKNTVSGLDTGDTFLRYFVQNELPFLRQRLAKTQGKCVVFAFTDISTFFTIAALTNIDVYDVKALPEQVQVVQQGSAEPVTFQSSRNRKGAFQIDISAGDSFSLTVAFQTVFKVRDKAIYIIPLPHPSSANNGVWAQYGDWRKKVGDLVRMIMTNTSSECAR